MADYVINPNIVLPIGNPTIVSSGIAGETILAGQVIADTSGLITLASSNSVPEAANVAGIALHSSNVNQHVSYVSEGQINVGASTFTQGDIVVLSPTTYGGLAPSSDLATGNTPAFIGIANSASVLTVKIYNSGVVKA